MNEQNNEIEKTEGELIKELLDSNILGEGVAYLEYEEGQPNKGKYKKIDLLYVTPTDVWIIEAKRKLNWKALGQVLGYGALFLLQEEILKEREAHLKKWGMLDDEEDDAELMTKDKNIRYGIVCSKSDLQIEIACHLGMGFQIDIFPLDEIKPLNWEKLRKRREIIINDYERLMQENIYRGWEPKYKEHSYSNTEDFLINKLLYDSDILEEDGIIFEEYELGLPDEYGQHKRIDLVFLAPETIWIIEAKTKLNWEAIGQVLGYGALFLHQEELFHQLKNYYQLWGLSRDVPKSNAEEYRVWKKSIRKKHHKKKFGIVCYKSDSAIEIACQFLKGPTVEVFPVDEIALSWNNLKNRKEILIKKYEDSMRRAISESWKPKYKKIKN